VLVVSNKQFIIGWKPKAIYIVVLINIYIFLTGSLVLCNTLVCTGVYRWYFVKLYYYLLSNVQVIFEQLPEIKLSAYKYNIIQ